MKVALPGIRIADAVGRSFDALFKAAPKMVFVVQRCFLVNTRTVVGIFAYTRTAVGMWGRLH